MTGDAPGREAPAALDALDETVAPGKTDAPIPPPRTTIKVCPDGPLLVRGSFVVVDADGQPVGDPGASVALCRCGKTGTAPFCDGTHKVVRPRA